MRNSIKADIIHILRPLFGDEFIQTVDNLYGDDISPEELIALVSKLLQGYLGEATAKNILEKLIKKHKLEQKIINS